MKLNKGLDEKRELDPVLNNEEFEKSEPEENSFVSLLPSVIFPNKPVDFGRASPKRDLGLLSAFLLSDELLSDSD